MTEKKFTPAVVFDFDGVIHSYISGWKGHENIPDPPVEGIGDEIKKLYDWGYDIYVVSTRATKPEGINAIAQYLKDMGVFKYIKNIQADKPPAQCYIDDRAIEFTGQTEGLAERVNLFKPWNHRGL